MRNIINILIKGVLSLATFIFIVVGFYQLYVELDDESGMFFISISMCFLLIFLGMEIESLFKEKHNESNND